MNKNSIIECKIIKDEKEEIFFDKSDLCNFFACLLFEKFIFDEY